MRSAERAWPRTRVRAGFTLAEVIVALTLLALLATLFFGVLSVQLRLARITAQRALDADAVRTAATVVTGELRRGTLADVYALAQDSLALRAFRGIAVVCAVAGADALVSYRGDRLPDPVKDSAVWLGGNNVAATVAITAVGPGTPGCSAPGGGAPQSWQTAPPLAGAGVLLLFEAGSYYLSTNALRYRIGAGGRQPLTAQLFADPPTFFAQPAPLTIDYRLGLRSTPARAIRAAVHYPALLPDTT